MIENFIIRMLNLTIILLFFVVYAQEESRVSVRPGRYNPQIFGVSGKYMPDNRGKYQHIPVPYDGGYGDRGEKYAHDEDDRSKYLQQRLDVKSVEVSNSIDNDGDGVGDGDRDEKSPYASSPYNPSSMIPDYIPQDWHPGEHTYAPKYHYDKDGWRIIQFQWSRDGKKRYSYFYETENKILAQEIGKLAQLSENTSAIRVDGFYQYEGDDGTVYEVDYVANENGFFPKGKHIHRSIQNILDYLMKNATRISTKKISALT